LVCEWPAGGIALTRHEIDAQVILEAAGRAQVIFKDEDLSDGGSRSVMSGLSSRGKPQAPA
jgi:hypothetical protein